MDGPSTEAEEIIPSSVFVHARIGLPLSKLKVGAHGSPPPIVMTPATIPIVSPNPFSSIVVSLLTEASVMTLSFPNFRPNSGSNGAGPGLYCIFGNSSRIFFRFNSCECFIECLNK